MKFVKITLLIVTGVAFLVSLWLFFFFRDDQPGQENSGSETAQDVEPKTVTNAETGTTPAGV